LPLGLDYGSPWRLRARVLELRRLVKGKNINVVHAHTLRAGFLCAWAFRNMPAVKLVYTPHGFRFAQKMNFLTRSVFRRIDRFVCRRADCVVVLASAERRDAERADFRNASAYECIPTFIDIPDVSRITPAVSARIPSETFVVGAIGRMTYQKDPFSFLEVAALVKKNMPNARFVWIGDGELRSEFERRAKDSGIMDSCFVTGRVDPDGVLAWLARINVVLLTSRFEGLPIVLLEALSMGVPIVAADVGSVSDIVRDGETGYLFEAGDSAKAAKLIVDVSQRSAIALGVMATREKEFIAKYYAPESREAVAYAQIYKSLKSSQ
jgi:glycosyltransferase involved in cell wall biosynthesis